MKKIMLLSLAAVVFSPAMNIVASSSSCSSSEQTVLECQKLEKLFDKFAEAFHKLDEYVTEKEHTSLSSSSSSSSDKYITETPIFGALTETLDAIKPLICDLKGEITNACSPEHCF